MLFRAILSKILRQVDISHLYAIIYKQSNIVVANCNVTAHPTPNPSTSYGRMCGQNKAIRGLLSNCDKPQPIFMASLKENAPVGKFMNSYLILTQHQLKKTGYFTKQTDTRKEYVL